jgi:hypothetical protein
MILMLLYVLVVLLLSNLAAQWAHKRLRKNYWEVFVISLFITPLFLIGPYYRYYRTRKSAFSK